MVWFNQSLTVTGIGYLCVRNIISSGHIWKQQWMQKIPGEIGNVEVSKK